MSTLEYKRGATNKFRCSFGERGDMYSRIKKICRKEIFKRNPIESISDVIK
jgi:hypothetical protein